MTRWTARPRTGPASGVRCCCAGTVWSTTSCRMGPAVILCVEFGTVSSWFVVGSVLVAAATFWAARRDAIRAQSSKVYFQAVERLERPVPNRLDWPDSTDLWHVTGDVKIYNLSEGPVFYVRVFDYQRPPGKIPLSRRWSRLRRWQVQLTYPLVGDGDGAMKLGELPDVIHARSHFDWTYRWVRKIKEQLYYGADATPAGHAHSASLAHSSSLAQSPSLARVPKDGNGRRWVRWPDGKLTRARTFRNLSSGGDDGARSALR